MTQTPTVLPALLRQSFQAESCRCCVQEACSSRLYCRPDSSTDAAPPRCCEDTASRCLLIITVYYNSQTLCLHVITCVTLVLSTVPQCHNTHARAVPSALQFKMEWRGRFQHTLAPGMRWSGSFRMRVGVRYMLASLQPCLAPVQTASPAASTCTESLAFPFSVIPSKPILQVEALLGHHV